MEIKEQTARRLYPESPEWFKKQLIEQFGEDKLKGKNFEDIKTFEDACKKSGIDPHSIGLYGDTPDELAYKKLKVITRAINGDWVLDWNNTNQRKWFPWFNLSSGFGFDSSYYGYSNSHSTVGSRLCF